MKKLLANVFVAILLSIVFSSCTSVQTISTPSIIENLPTPSKVSAPPKLPTPTTTSTVELTITPSPFPTTSEQATIEAFGSLCTNSKDILGSEISPDGKWIAAVCIGESETEDSPLEVIRMDRSKDWKIYFRDYNQGPGYDHKSIIIPYRWSKDSRYIYSVSPTKASGCCWIGGKYVLLVRLDLDTGEQVELLNVTDPSSHSPITFTISDNDRYLLFTSSTPQQYEFYDFAILDLFLWETQVVKLEFPKSINLDFAVMSPDETKIVLPLFDFHEDDFEYKLDSIALIDVSTNEQKLLITDLSEKKKVYYPVCWLDDNQVLLNTLEPYYLDHPYFKDTAEYWTININTGELVQTEKP